MHNQPLQTPHISSQHHLLHSLLIFLQKRLTRISIANNSHQLILGKTLPFQLQLRPRHRRHQVVLEPVHPSPLPRLHNNLIHQMMLNCSFGNNRSKMIFVPQSFEYCLAVAELVDQSDHPHRIGKFSVLASHHLHQKTIDPAQLVLLVLMIPLHNFLNNSKVQLKHLSIRTPPDHLEIVLQQRTNRNYLHIHTHLLL